MLCFVVVFDVVSHLVCVVVVIGCVCLCLRRVVLFVVFCVVGLFCLLRAVIC